ERHLYARDVVRRQVAVGRPSVGGLAHLSAPRYATSASRSAAFSGFGGMVAPRFADCGSRTHAARCSGVFVSVAAAIVAREARCVRFGPNAARLMTPSMVWHVPHLAAMNTVLPRARSESAAEGAFAVRRCSDAHSANRSGASATTTSAMC